MGASGSARVSCPQVQDVVKCQMGVCRADESEDSPDSCKNGQLQILVSKEACADSPPHPTPDPTISSLPSPSHLKTETGFKLCSAADCREVLGKGLPHSVFSLQFEAMVGGTSGGKTKEPGDWGEEPEPSAP